jgi:hypothetical protein
MSCWAHGEQTTAYCIPLRSLSMRRSTENNIETVCGSTATALYFYGSILLRALKSKITVILTYA